MTARPPRKAAPHEVRIIGGRWKRTRLPVADRPGLRPTLDRVRETLFNWLGQDLSGWRCLDAFAGTGALGFEAASRGATHCVLLEQDRDLVRRLGALREKLAATELHIECADALGWMQRWRGEAFDLVFLDPPFAAGLHEAALKAAARITRPGGWVYVESGEAPDPAVLRQGGLQVWREARAGAVRFALLQREAPIHSTPAGAIDAGGLPPDPEKR